MAGVTFSVQVYEDKRWIVESEFSDEAVAIKHADGLVTAAEHDAIKVIRERVRGDGTLSESEIFNKKITGRKKKITIVPIEETNQCADDEDFYRLESRSTIGRLLRKFLDEVFVTSMEFLHNYQLIKKFMNHDIYPAAVDRIATLQATASGTSSRTRRDELFVIIDRLADRAHRADSRRRDGDLTKVLAKAQESDGNLSDDFLVRVALAHDLSDIRSWSGKLQRLLTMIGDTPSDGQALLVDGFIADILSVPEAVQELLGNQANLGAVIMGLVDLLCGSTDETPQTMNETAMVLQRLLLEGHFPSADTVIVDRVRRLILSPQVLSRNAPDQEDDIFRIVFSRLITIDGILGGPVMAEALTSRFGRRFEGGKTAGSEMALFGLADLLRDRSYKIRYLVMIASTKSGTIHATAIGDAILKMVNTAPDIHNFCYYRLAPIKKLTIITDLMRKIQESVLEERFQVEIMERFDSLLVLYIEREKLVEKLDDPKHHLSLRAVRLVKFCGSGILLEGKALNLVRQRVIELLRRPHFVEEFTSVLENERERERSIRDFRALLGRSGFEA